MKTEMNIKKTILLVVLIFSSFGIFAQEEIKEERKVRISIEIDPSTFGFNGYGFHLRIKPKFSEHLLIGVGAYAMDFPDLLVGLNKNNKNKGWNVRLNQGYGLFGEYHFSEVNKKWFIGSQLAVQEYKINKSKIQGQSGYINLLLMATGGYTLQPFDFGLYFKFWAGAGYTDKISGNNFVGSAEYEISPLLLFGALHIGYIFK